MSEKAGLVHTEDSRPRPEGYGAALKDHFTGAQKRRPASALQAYRENWPFVDDSGMIGSPAECGGLIEAL